MDEEYAQHVRNYSSGSSSRAIAVYRLRVEKPGAFLPSYTQQRGRNGPTLADAVSDEVYFLLWPRANVRRVIEGNIEEQIQTFGDSNDVRPLWRRLQWSYEEGADDPHVQDESGTLAEGSGPLPEERRVKRDIFHAMNGLTQALKKGHGAFQRFQNLFSEAMLAPSVVDLERCKQWCEEQAKKEGTRAEVVYQRNYRKFLQQHVRRTVPPPASLKQRVQMVVDTFAEMKDSDDNEPLFTAKAWDEHRKLMKHIAKGCLSDHPKIPLYVEKRTASGLPLFLSLRGTNDVESFHASLKNVLATNSISPQLANMELREFAFRCDCFLGLFLLYFFFSCIFMFS